MNDYGSPMVTYDEIVEALKAILDCSRNNGYLDEYSFLNAKYDTIKKNPLQIEKEQALINAIQSIEQALNEANENIRKTLEEEIEKINAVNVLTIPTDYAHTFELRKLAAQDEFVYKLTEMSLPLEVLTNHSEETKQIEALVDFANVFEEIDDSGTVVGVLKSEEEPQIEEVEEEKVEPAKEKEEHFSIQFDSLPEVEETPAEVEPVEESSTEAAEESTEQVQPVKEVEEKPTEESEEQDDKKLGKIKLIKKALEKAKEKKNDQLIKVLEQQLAKEVKNLKS